MLIQSQNDYIDLLPALPDTWHTGSLKGFRVRGGAEIDIKWIDKKIETFSVKSDVSNTFKVKVPQNTTSFMLKSRELPITDGFVSLDLKAGEKVIIDIR
jgi:alpha-L-fucosidase 2